MDIVAEEGGRRELPEQKGKEKKNGENNDQEQNEEDLKGAEHARHDNNNIDTLSPINAPKHDRDRDHDDDQVRRGEEGIRNPTLPYPTLPYPTLRYPTLP